MVARKSHSEPVRPTLSTDKAYLALKNQLTALKTLEGRNYQEADTSEQEWEHLTQSIIEKAFGSPSSNLSKFNGARWAGTHQIVPYGGGVPHGRLQNNFDARIQAYGALLRSLVAELELDLPQAEVAGVYTSGEEYEFYRDLRAILQLGERDIFIVDPYANVEIFDAYATAISRQTRFRLLTTNLANDLLLVARKYAGGGNFELRTSSQIHDRVIFVDERVWLVGQSLKDAAKKKPTYIVEHDYNLMRAAYETIWSQATVVI